MSIKKRTIITIILLFQVENHCNYCNRFDFLSNYINYCLSTAKACPSNYINISNVFDMLSFKLKNLFLFFIQLLHFRCAL